MESIFISIPRRYGILAIFYSVCFIGLGIFILLQDKQDWMVWLSVIFFGLVVIRILSQLKNYPLPVARIDEKGIFMGRKERFIPWSDIRGAYVHTRFKSFICIRLRDSSHYINSLGLFDNFVLPFAKLMGFTETGLNLSGTKIEPTEITNVINSRCTANELTI